MNVSWPIVSFLCAAFGIAVGLAIPWLDDRLIEREQRKWDE